MSNDKTKDEMKDQKSSSLLAVFSRQPAEVRAGVLTLGAALLTVLIPNAIVEKLVVKLGISSLIPAIAPPISYTGRGGIALMAALVGGIVAYFYLTKSKGKKKLKPIGSKKMKPETESVETVPEKSIVDRLRRGYKDTVAPKETEWDANPVDSNFRPIDVERDLGARFDDFPYLQDPNRAYQNHSQPSQDMPGHAAIQGSGQGNGISQGSGVSGGTAAISAAMLDAALGGMRPPPPAERPELELDPESTLSDPQWRMRPAEALRETMLDLSPDAQITPVVAEEMTTPVVETPVAVSPPTKSMPEQSGSKEPEKPVEIDYVAMRRRDPGQDHTPSDTPPAWFNFGLDIAPTPPSESAPISTSIATPVAENVEQGFVPLQWPTSLSETIISDEFASATNSESYGSRVEAAAVTEAVAPPLGLGESISAPLDVADVPISAPVATPFETIAWPKFGGDSTDVRNMAANDRDADVLPAISPSLEFEPESEPQTELNIASNMQSEPGQQTLERSEDLPSPTQVAGSDSSVHVLLARLEGALVERASRRAKMRLETPPAGLVPGLEKTEQDMSGALKDALAALQNAAHHP